MTAVNWAQLHYETRHKRALRNGDIPEYGMLSASERSAEERATQAVAVAVEATLGPQHGELEHVRDELATARADAVRWRNERNAHAASALELGQENERLRSALAGKVAGAIAGRSGGS